MRRVVGGPQRLGWHPLKYEGGCTYDLRQGDESRERTANMAERGCCLTWRVRGLLYCLFKVYIRDVSQRLTVCPPPVAHYAATP